MKKTSRQLADGRDIFYYDPDGSPLREAIDQRNHDVIDNVQGTMRYDLISGEWVAIAGHRQQRVLHPSVAECPLCPSSSDRQSEIPEDEYNVVVFENRFPSFSGAANYGDSVLDANWGDELPAAGRCEVIAYSSNHHGSLATMTKEQMELVIAAWIDRSLEISKLTGVKYVFVFENRGAEVGVTLHHPHGQIYGYPYIPTYAAKLIDQAQSYRKKHHRAMLDDVIARELLADERIVFQDSNWVAFVPHAARWPYEIQVHPLRNIAYLSDLNSREIDSLSVMLPKLVSALDLLFDHPLPYMAGWIQAPVSDEKSSQDSRLFFRLVSIQRGENKLKYLAGSESLMGAWISDVLPEEAAQRIKDKLQQVMTP